jgi:hypothetical protein
VCARYSEKEIVQGPFCDRKRKAELVNEAILADADELQALSVLRYPKLCRIEYGTLDRVPFEGVHIVQHSI